MRVGNLIIFTGASGAGKDSVMDGFLTSPEIQKLKLKKIVTCTDRLPRPGEINGANYHFLTPEKLREMEKQGKLTEPITLTGSSNKATPKSEIERLFKGENLVWRIDPSRAAEVASGEFFKRLFPKTAEEMQKHTLILFITAPKTIIDQRRKRRDSDKYNPNEYAVRDKQERPFLEILKQKATPIQNLDKKLNKAVDFAVKSVINFCRK